MSDMREGMLLCFVLLGFVLLVLLCPYKDTFAEEKKPQTPSVSLKSIPIAFYDLPDVSFAGYLLAQEKGYYKEAGLPPIEFIWRNDKQTVFDLLGQGKAHFAISWMAEGMQAAANDANIVAISRTLQRPSETFIVRRDLNPTLNSIDSFDGHGIGICFRHHLTASAWLNSKKVKAKEVIYRPESGVIFNKGCVDIVSMPYYKIKAIMQFSRYRDVTLFFPLMEEGVNYPEDTVFCSKSFLQEHTQICRKFLDATYRGWRYVYTNPEETTEVIANYCEQLGRFCDSFMIKQQLKYWLDLMNSNSSQGPYGFCDRKDYDALKTILTQSNLNHQKTIPKYEDFFFDVLNDSKYK